MSPQPPNTYPAAHPDARIDQVLHALRTTEAPSGLEQRIAARLAQAAEARTQSAITNPTTFSYVTVILNAVKDPRILLARAPRYWAAAAALTLLIALTTLTLLHRRAPLTTAEIAPNSSTPVAHKAFAPSLEGAGLQSRHNAPIRTAALATEGISPSASQPSQTATTSTEQQDPDAIALAETLAPSRPAPPLPLTAQEHLLLAATRPGQPIEIAELDIARAPFLRAAAEARETASIDHYAKSLLAPFALADALSPTTFSQPQETSTPAPPPPPNASSN